MSYLRDSFWTAIYVSPKVEMDDYVREGHINFERSIQSIRATPIRTSACIIRFSACIFGFTER